MVSVALAAFNGEKYIKEQLISILKQSVPVDEIVVSLDKSKDRTYAILEHYKKADSRIKVIDGPNKGVIKNFENAINLCSGDIIFLCDQDDVWLEDKVKSVLIEFEKDPKINLVIHDAIITDEKLNILHSSFFKKNNSEKGKLKNIIKNSYVGACMAFRKELKKSILPFPKNIPMHDQWIGLIAEFKGDVAFLKDALIKYRRHQNTVTSFKSSSFFNILKWRFNLIKSLISNGN